MANAETDAGAVPRGGSAATGADTSVVQDAKREAEHLADKARDAARSYASEKKEARQRATDALHFAPFAPIVELSVKHGRGISKLMSTVDRAHAEFQKRVTTSELNRFVQEVVERTPPPSQRGRVPRIYYLTQVHSAPPLFVAMCSSPKAFPESYRRFLQNRLQQAFDMSMVPVRLRFRARRRRERPDSSSLD